MGSESTHTPGADRDPEATPRLTARIVVDDGEPECTIHPADATSEELLTTWITAVGDSFVELAAMQ
ncbi:hypothetical protein C453_07893 [Haloferax elongans ATCC BAA-1513]|uniref:DUF7511 domain-containing protein n=1 Tax=Haloferax elongans ATCC BAA-1513 TaxID=1230453 RepID=M0HMB7_HALEO|nr:hypothetical protein [Haloferax elongans]ELZ85720.1 hypothetical protein C453_07893 [Haloferax elongans ATCC BAA-1513]